MRKNLLIVLLFSLFVLGARYSSDVVGFFYVNETLTVQDSTVSPVDKLSFSVTGTRGYITPESISEIVVNIDGDDTDFLIEGSGDVNLFVLDAGTDKVGIGKTAPAEKLEVGGNALVSNAGGDSNSYRLLLTAHMTAGDETQTSSLRTAWGLDPYTIVASPNATGVETDVIHLDTASLRCAADGGLDIGSTGAGRFNDVFIAGNLDAEVGAITAQTNITADTGAITATAGAVAAGTTVTAGTGITSTTGNIAASAGSVSASTTLSAGTTVTAGTGITSTTGNVTASAGSHVDQYANVRMARPIVDADVPAEPFACAAGTYGWIIPVDDTNDTLASWLCWCARTDDIGGYAWRKVSDEGSCF